MRVKAVKTVMGEKPMTETDVFDICDAGGREGRLICLFPETEYQEIKGFGGAFTEAASTTLDTLCAESRENVLKLYFDESTGIGYNIGRVHINSCDFSLGNYTCIREGDNTLESFNIERDKKSVIPMIKDAMKINGGIKIFASPWSPPAYMKTNGQMNGGGKLLKEYYDLWAEYYKRFIEEYGKEGIGIRGVTVQNEAKAVQTWDSCVYTAEEERDFIKNHLGPVLKGTGVKIMFWDHNKERVLERAGVTLGDEECEKYVSGIAVHWYSGDHFEQLLMFHEKYPEKNIVFSEGCYEFSKGDEEAVKIGEKYAHDMIGNFNSFCNAFCDWNLLLDEKGGPNHVGNYCQAPVMINTKTGEIIVNASYYYIGHFSKFVKKGAKRIGSSKWTSDIDTVSFKNPDGSIVSVVLNATDEEKEFYFYINGQTVETNIEGHSIATYIFENL